MNTITDRAPHDASVMLETPFHPRIAAANGLQSWYNWKGYVSAERLDQIEFEYFAIRNATAVFDICPMTKYRIEGPDAEAFLNRLFTRDVRKIRTHRVGYGVW
jgi:aminomethyltransferase